jgi:hypothetical protein
MRISSGSGRSGEDTRLEPNRLQPGAPECVRREQGCPSLRRVSAGPATRPAADVFNLSSTMTVQCLPLGCARRLKWEDGLRTVLGISETVLDEIPDRKPTGSIASRLHQIANDVAAACASIVATVREVLDDRFWE